VPAPPALTIAPGRPGDIPALGRLRASSFRALAASHYTAREIEAWLRFSAGSLQAVNWDRDGFFTARARGAIAGFSWAALGDRAHLRSLYVEPALAGLGFGKALLEAAESHCRRRRVRVLYVAAALNAVPFYVRNGYSACGDFVCRMPAEGGAPPVEIRVCKMIKEFDEQGGSAVG
jgi:putative acetyltransferase